MISRCRGRSSAKSGSGHVSRASGQQGVIGVGQGFPGDLPGLLPGQEMFVHQEPHQFRHGDGRMGIVELDRKAFMEGVQALLPQQR